MFSLLQACEVNTVDELILTELVFENILDDLEPAEIAAVLSAGVFQKKTDQPPMLTEQLLHAQKRVVSVAHSLGVVQMECGLDIVPDEFAREHLRFGLMEAGGAAGAGLGVHGCWR